LSQRHDAFVGRTPKAAAHQVATPLGFSCPAAIVTSFEAMALTPNTPAQPAGMRPDFRLVVKARTSGHKGYVWEILREDDPTHPPVSQSSRSFATMEEAFTHGSVALALIRARGVPAPPG
jgi:hypothetical protein